MTTVDYLYWPGRKVPELGERVSLPDGRLVQVTHRRNGQDGQPRHLTVHVLAEQEDTATA